MIEAKSPITYDAGTVAATSQFADRLEALDFIPTISANDRMYSGSRPEGYFKWGLAAVGRIQTALRAANAGEPRNVLDLPCGHGRVSRMLRATFPAADLTACDIDPDCVDFCAHTFGATPLYSAEHPRDIELAENFDLIWCGSLLTHLPLSGWRDFLAFFSQHLARGGVLVFTIGGRRIVDEIRDGRRTFSVPDLPKLVADCDSAGFAHQDYVQASNMGITVALPRWVCGELERYPELVLTMYTEGGWNGRQDAVACSRAQ